MRYAIDYVFSHSHMTFWQCSLSVYCIAMMSGDTHNKQQTELFIVTSVVFSFVHSELGEEC